LSKQVGPALIGTAGDYCVVSECQVEVCSRPSEPQWRNFLLFNFYLTLYSASELPMVGAIANPMI